MTHLFRAHDAAWRDPAQVVAQWGGAGEVAPSALRARVRGSFWEILAELRVRLLVSREYEHLVVALGVEADRPSISYLPMPHPSGIAVDRARGIVHVASTRNPNQVYDLQPVVGEEARLDVDRGIPLGRPLVPVRSRFFPGSLYMHDLAIVGGRLHGNAVGQNAVVELGPASGYRRVWWPRCIEGPDGPVFGRNHLQLNSIAAGPTIRDSFFSASTDEVTRARPGHRNFRVDRRGVVFSGRTREPIARGLTRPHSTRLRRGGVWVDDSGYGTLCAVRDGRPEVVAHLPGWTRGLCFVRDVAFVGTSRVLPRFHHYAPGLDVDSSRCGIHAVDVRTGSILGSLIWPSGDQIFAIDWVPEGFTTGLPFQAGRRSAEAVRKLFYAFATSPVRTPRRR